MYTYQVEEYQDCITEVSAHYEEHWKELAADPSIPLNPHYEQYDLIAQAGLLHVTTVRYNGKLVGYHFVMLSPHLHYKQSLTAFTDIFYLEPEHRNGWIGVKLFKTMESTLKDRGVQRIYMGTKLKSDIGPILDRLGYNPIERLYTKIIG